MTEVVMIKAHIDYNRFRLGMVPAIDRGMKMLINNMVVSEVKTALIANPKFMKYEDGFLNGEVFRDQVIYKASTLNMSVNQIVAEYLAANGC